MLTFSSFLDLRIKECAEFRDLPWKAPSLLTRPLKTVATVETDSDATTSPVPKQAKPNAKPSSSDSGILLLENICRLEIIKFTIVFTC